MYPRRIPFRSMFALPLAAALAVAGCDAVDDDLGEPDEGVTPAEEPATTPDEPAAAGEAVSVQLDDFSIEMPRTLPAGPTTFRVTNVGAVEHNFEVEGQGIEEEFDENLEPGESRTMEVDLEAGEYRVYCPVGDHEDRGMTLMLTVEDRGGANGGETGGTTGR